MGNEPAGPRSNKYVILAIVLVGVLMSVLDGSVVNIALPTITASFCVDVALSQWTITACLVTMTALLLFFGRVSDFTGKAGIVHTRVHGRGGKHPRPDPGGFLVDSLGWRYIFLINLPIGIVLVACALLFLRTGEARSPEFHMDWPGAGTLAISLVSLMLFFSTIGGFSDSPLLPIVSGALFLVFTVLFVLRESTCDRPLLDLRIFRVRGFLLPVVAMMLFFIANDMMNIAGPFSFVVLALLARQYSLAGMSACVFFLGLGSALFQSPNNTEIMNSLPRSQTAIASSVSSAGRNLAMTLGTAFASTLLPLLLRLAGHRGTVIGAERGLLAGSIATVMLVSAVVCLLAAVALLFNWPTTGTSETAERE